VKDGQGEIIYLLHPKLDAKSGPMRKTE
jgi:hypothetical protein